MCSCLCDFPLLQHNYKKGFRANDISYQQQVKLPAVGYC